LVCLVLVHGILMLRWKPVTLPYAAAEQYDAVLVPALTSTYIWFLYIC
jgi:hypothetical protein